MGCWGRWPLAWLLFHPAACPHHPWGYRCADLRAEVAALCQVLRDWCGLARCLSGVATFHKPGLLWQGLVANLKAGQQQREGQGRLSKWSSSPVNEQRAMHERSDVCETEPPCSVRFFQLFQSLEINTCFLHKPEGIVSDVLSKSQDVAVSNSKGMFRAAVVLWALRLPSFHWSPVAPASSAAPQSQSKPLAFVEDSLGFKNLQRTSLWV